MISNPSVLTLRSLAAVDAVTKEHNFPTKTSYGSSCYVSTVRSRSAKFTRSKVDNQWQESDYALLEKVKQYVANRELIQVDRIMGEHERYQRICRLIVTKDYARIAHGWGELMIPVEYPMAEPDFITYMVPEWPERAILVDGEEGSTYALGTDYIGEAKKSFLRQDMYKIKKEQGLGLHAGSKIVYLKDIQGQFKLLGQMYFGLSATGKSTLTSHGFWLKDDEYTKLVQDDVVRWLPDGQVLGTEGKGLFIKTDGLSVEEQPEIYRAAIAPGAILENVWVNKDGTIDFHNTTLTKNGRAVVLRSDMPNVSKSIDIDHVDQIFFITRNSLVPPIGKLSPAQAGCAFMLGESVESSAGDPTKAGQAIRVVGTNPFIIGPRGNEGTIFVGLVRANPTIQCYLLNTGTVGPGGKSSKKITLKDTVHFLVRVSRGNIEWQQDKDFGFEIPKGLAGSRFDPRKYYARDVFETLMHTQKKERRQWLEQFSELSQEIKKAVY